MCNTFYYTATWPDDSALDPTVFTFDSTNRLFYVSTTDKSWIGIWTIKITGSILLDPNIKNSMTFLVDIRDSC
jgi:hypothetical protein